MDNMLALLGFGLVGTFVAVVMTSTIRISAAVALILVPVVFAVLGGFRQQLGAMVLDGLQALAPTAAMLIFAILYFAVMIDAGLFNPIVKRAVAAVRGDPMRASVATSILALVVSLDGDGATTIMVTVSALLPIYRQLRMSPLLLATLVMISNMIVNIAPWGGPTARAAAVLKVDPSELFLPLIPTMIVGALGTMLLAYVLGCAERRRLHSGPVEAAEAQGEHPSASNGVLPEVERNFVFNLVLTLAVMGCVVLGLLPLSLVFMIGFAIALSVNFPALEAQRQLLKNHALNVVNVTVLLFAAAVFTGVLTGTGMVEAMALALMDAVPAAVGPYLGGVTALLAMPLTFFMSNDAYYFGILPVIAQTAQNHGVPAIEIGRAALLGGPVHGLSPLLAAMYLLCAMTDIEPGDFQRFALKWTVMISLLMTATALLSGAVSFAVRPAP